SVKPWSSVTGSCTGTLGATIAGTSVWSTSNILTFTPSAALTANKCYRISVANTAADSAANTLAATFNSDFTTLSGTAPTLTLTNSLIYPGGSLTATGSGWNNGTNVVPKWEDGTTLDSTGATVSSGA